MNCRLVLEQEEWETSRVMNNMPLELPPPAAQLLKDLDGALGDKFVGAIVFGSWAEGSASARNEVDLAAIISDVDAELNRQAVFRVLRFHSIDPHVISLSVETYMRLKEFVEVGDPFAWVVCREGRIVHDRDGGLAGLQAECRNHTSGFDADAVRKYLEGKSSDHGAQAIQAMNQFLSHLQLSMMAAAQAVAVPAGQAPLSGTELVAMSDWANLKNVLEDFDATRDEIDMVENLIMANKRAGSNETFPGKIALDQMQAANELWRRLLNDGAVPTHEG